MKSSAVVATLIADPRSIRLSDAHIARLAQGVGGFDSQRWLDEGVAADLLEEATAAREARTADVGTLEEAIEAGTVGFARVRLGALGPDGEDRLAEQAITVRCLQRPDGSLAEPGDDEADLVAVVARSY